MEVNPPTTPSRQIPRSAETDALDRSDFLDAKIDTFSPRTASRPLPSGRCSPRSALAWFIAQLVFTNGAIYLLLGSATYATLAPCLVIALVYPLSKRYIRCPQLVLAPTVAWPIFAGWISAQSAARLPERINICCGLMWLSHAIWNVYYDTCYGLQDIVGDAHAGVGSMAKFLGMRCFKPALMGMMVVALGTFGLATMQLRCSLFFWVLTVGVWGLTVPLQLWMLDFRIPKSGGWVLRFNLDLGMYLTAVIMVEVLVLNVREIS